ncbi:uncharacterized protein LOC134177369 isoform X2 [Corticium candelabrum]|uniref:uncharacterized protein LOC134177369 isoform X2 n=1 Tax=Corticium candelabrum TaxID=121492 RepID=UPI002E25EC37|nr:uncharacterized protein LOC134177369 isoform X2 [Corticium candelabrum]
MSGLGRCQLCFTAIVPVRSVPSRSRSKTVKPRHSRRSQTKVKKRVQCRNLEDTMQEEADISIEALNMQATVISQNVETENECLDEPQESTVLETSGVNVGESSELQSENCDFTRDRLSATSVQEVEVSVPLNLDQ